MSQETILLAVTGMSPAVLTETVWALARETEPVIPKRVIAVTTAEGKKEIVKALFHSAAGEACVWDELRAHLESSGHDTRGKLRFGTTPDDIRVICGLDSSTMRSMELEDLRSRADSESAADFLLDQVRAITANPDTRLIVSIAGGRKTMGALLYACMTLAGREEDRVTHVLVSEPYERLRTFFFPGQFMPAPLDASYLPMEPPIIELADVPFVPLRNLFQRELGRDAGTFSHLVASCGSGARHRAAEDLRLELFVQRPALRLNASELRLTEREHHLLLCLANRAKHELAPLCSYSEALDALAGHMREWDALVASGKLKVGTPPAASFTEEHDITRTLSALRGKLKALGPAGLILAEAMPARGRFSIDIPPSLIAVL